MATQDEKTRIHRLKHGETRDSVTETQRQTRVLVGGYITVFVFLSLRLQRNWNTLLHVSDRFPF